jgi:glycosyltransferase involved in cell wall biosynthesis
MGELTLRTGRLKEISFDLYERYVLLGQIEKIFRSPGSAYRVLDVGGHTPAFWPGFPSLAGALIPDATVAVVDVLPKADLKNYVQASGLRLPFRDGAFDLVCSLDTLEHIPAEHRPAFLAELLRVTRDGLYLAFPFDSPSNRWAESVLVEYTNALLHDPIPALLEHRQFGLPEQDLVPNWLAGHPYPWVTFAQGNTDVWLLMMLTYHSLRKPGTDFVQELNQRFNHVYAAQDWGAPAYRCGYVISKRRALPALEDLRASFVRPGTSADIQSILSFCQLFLNIAQNGRVTADKDRHIRNIESELAATRPYRDKWTETAGLLRHLEARLLEAPLYLDPPDSPAAWPRDREQRLVEAAGSLQEVLAKKELENRELKSRFADMNDKLEQLRQQVDKLEQLRQQVAGLEVQRRQDLELEQAYAARMDDRMRGLEVGLVTNKRAVQAIYDSRIWRALSVLGGVLLRLAGKSSGRPHTANLAPERTAAPGMREAVPEPGPVEEIALVCDHPCEHASVAGRDLVEIRGWALAPSGIDRVSIRINDEFPVTAAYGIPRPDVARNHPAVLGSGSAGFRYFWDSQGLPEGPCTVQITAYARSGAMRVLACHVVIDRTLAPGYAQWIQRHEPGAEEKRRMRADTEKFAVRPCISIAVPVYKTPIPVLKRCIESVRLQIYPHWELCLADDASDDPGIQTLLQEYSRNDPRIRLCSLPRNRGIAAATNEALRLASGEYVAFLDHDDELADFALWELVRSINEHPDISLFYSDEDKIDEQGNRYDPFFKPEWSPDLFRSCNYICHLVTMKRSLLDELGGLNDNYNGSQDYELLLRATERTQKLMRIPKVLYHWRSLAGSAAADSAAKPQACENGRRALEAYLARTAPGATVEAVKACRYRVRYPIIGNPRVSILVPTNGHKNLFRAALESLLDKTAYKNYDVLLIDNSISSRVEDYALSLTARHAPIRYLDWRGQPFNFSRMNNEAARRADSPYIAFLNDDTTVITGEWLSAMLEHAQRPDVGAVGAQLWYPDNVIQHAGVVMGLYGNCSHAFKSLPVGPSYYFDFPDIVRNCSAVTGACMLLARDKFFQAGAFDEINLAVAFQDVDLCLKLLDLGYRNVYTPYARLYHYESATKTDKDKIPDPAEDGFMKTKWAKYISDDPYYSPNLTRNGENFSLAVE